jgi:hypothetical protein
MRERVEISIEILLSYTLRRAAWGDTDGNGFRDPLPIHIYVYSVYRFLRRNKPGFFLLYNRESMFSSKNALMALAMPGLAAYAQTADLSQSIAPAVPVVFTGDWSWTGRYDLDIIDWLCGYVPRRTGNRQRGTGRPAGWPPVASVRNESPDIPILALPAAN